jgi:hypothetical protein
MISSTLFGVAVELVVVDMVGWFVFICSMNSSAFLTIFGSFEVELDSTRSIFGADDEFDEHEEDEE